MLKSLELFGFKSFADRTSFAFSNGITCVVGPNGSGKSNVVDALKWILGDQSPKSLRGKEMTDVIFNGSVGRKPSAFAEAIVVFDNSNGLLPVDSQEVEVGRRVWRNGDSEYLLNRTPVRLKDIRDLFLGTGLGGAAYSIIEQGRVDQILQTNASSRREVFEEAAGISRYKSRRTEALRKLERVGQNLVRLTDIVDQAEAQLNSTRSQASKAAKSRQLEQELREMRLGLAADDFRHLSVRLESSQQTVDDLAQRIEALRATQRELEAQHAVIDEQVTQVDDRLRRVERDQAGNREVIAREGATVRHQRARLTEMGTELARLRQQRVDLERRARSALTELSQSGDQLNQFEQTCAQTKSECEHRDGLVGNLRTAIESLTREAESGRARAEKLARETTAAEKAVSEIEARQMALAASKQPAIERQSELQELLSASRGELEDRQARFEAARLALDAADQNLEQILDARSEASDQRNTLLKELADKREMRSAWQARRSVLEDLEQRQEGLRIGVKEILERARTSKHAPWKHIRGSVADLLEVDLEHAAIVEIALDDRAQLLVLDELGDLVEYLKRGTFEASERVGFIALSSIQVQPGGAASASPTAQPSTRDLSSRPGIVRRADQLVRSDAKAPGLSEYLLADTWIVQDLGYALKLAAGEGKGSRFVTLLGERLEPDGRLYVGLSRTENTIVSRKSELRKLKADLQILDGQIRDAVDQLAQLEESITQVDAEVAEARKRSNVCTAKATTCQADLAEYEQRCDRLQQDISSVEQTLATKEREAAQLSESLESSRVESARREEELQHAYQEIGRVEQQIEQDDLRLTELLQQRNAAQLQLATQEERLSSLRAACTRLQKDHEQFAAQSEEAARRYERALEKQGQVNIQILNAEAVISERFISVQELEARELEILSEREQFRGQRAELAEKVAENRNGRRELEDKRHTEEIAVRDLRHGIETLEERLREEYQIEVTEVAATDASAFRQYCERAGGEEATESDQAETAEPRPFDHELKFEDVREEIDAQVKRLQRKHKLIGYVNADTLDELDELENRFSRLSAQLQDLVEAKAALEEIVRRINSASRRMFTESFETVRGHFRFLFRRLFGGGEGDIVLEDPNDVLECGIDIVSRPPGKELRSISLLSGGEKTLTAVGLLLAIFQSRPSPFCILDEVDAALDEANIDRYLEVLKDFQSSTQFIVITHSKRTMAAGDTLYGVTMEQSGVSKRMSVRFDDVSENGTFNAAA